MVRAPNARAIPWCYGFDRVRFIEYSEYILQSVLNLVDGKSLKKEHASVKKYAWTKLSEVGHPPSVPATPQPKQVINS
jgi:hypothetical protein